MNTILPYEIKNQLPTDSTIEINAINPGYSRHSAFRKNSRTPWDASALEGIRLQTALSALRSKDKEMLALQSQMLNNLNG